MNLSVRVYQVWILLCWCHHSCWAEEDTDKALPEKGEGCPNVSTLDSNLFINPCDPLITQEIPISAVDFTMYAALPPYATGYFVPFAYFIVKYLDMVLPQYEISFPLGEGDLYILIGVLFHFTKNSNKPQAIAKVTLINAEPHNIEKTKSGWWWEYRFVFGCEYGAIIPDKTTGDPITDPALKQEIRNDIDREIQTLGYILQTLKLYEYSRGAIGFAIDDPRVTDPPFVFQRPAIRNDGPFRVPPIPTIPTVSSWDWQSAVGGILLVIVVVVFTTITHLAGIRHRQRFKMDLTTPDGVEALLDVQWRHQQDDTIHIYHRKAHQVYKPEAPPPIYEQYNEEQEEVHLIRDTTTEFI